MSDVFEPKGSLSRYIGFYSYILCLGREVAFSEYDHIFFE